MSAVKNKKFANLFSMGLEFVEVIWDFAKDGGAVAVFDLLEMKEAVLIIAANTEILTTCTSGGSATVEMGVKSGTTNAILAATAVASLTAAKGFPCAAAGDGLYVASGGILSMEVKVAALTAGKIKLICGLYKA